MDTKRQRKALRRRRRQQRKASEGIREKRKEQAAWSGRVGDCYETAFHYFWEQVAAGNGDRFRLAHGVAILQGGPQKGQPFGHAWVEETQKNTATEKHATLPRDLYYHAGEIDSDKVKLYTWEEARQKIIDLGHYGPWELPEGTL